MSSETPNPQPGDRVRVTLEGRFVDDETGPCVELADRETYGIPDTATVAVLERADDPSKDLIGTVRREQHAEDATGEGYSVWQHMQYQVAPSKAGSHWLCTHSTHFGNLGEALTHDQVRGMPVIGAAPGTPAAEAADPKVGLFQTLPDGYSSWEEYHEKHPYVPRDYSWSSYHADGIGLQRHMEALASRRAVRVPNEPHGPSAEVLQRVRDELSLGFPLVAVNVLKVATGWSLDEARVYVEGMEEYQTYLNRTEVNPTEADRVRAMGFDRQPEFKLGDDDRKLIRSVLLDRQGEYFDSGNLYTEPLAGVVADIVWAAIKRDRERGDR